MINNRSPQIGVLLIYVVAFKLNHAAQLPISCDAHNDHYAEKWSACVWLFI